MQDDQSLRTPHSNLESIFAFQSISNLIFSELENKNNNQGESSEYTYPYIIISLSHIV